MDDQKYGKRNQETGEWNGMMGELLAQVKLYLFHETLEQIAVNDESPSLVWLSYYNSSFIFILQVNFIHGYESDLYIQWSIKV